MSNAPRCLSTVYDTASTAVSVCKPVVLDCMTWARAAGESVPSGGNGDRDGGAGGKEVHDISTSPSSPTAQRVSLLTCGIARCPFHKYTTSAYGLASFPRKRESRSRAPWGLDARLRGHDVLLAPDLRNRHLVVRLLSFDRVENRV